MQESIETKLNSLRAHVLAAETAAGRKPGSVQVLAVSKRQSAAKIREAYAAGQCAIGENYLQEALDKMAQLTDLAIEWHFIGAIQSRKCQAIAEHFAWVHSVDRLKIAAKLSQARPDPLHALNICLQVNVNQEASKAGVSLEQLPELADHVARLPGLRLRGLMTIPAATEDVTEQHHNFMQVYEASQRLIKQGLSLDTLSMGMSQDFPAAIAAGATLIRIGTGIFGPREVDTRNK